MDDPIKTKMAAILQSDENAEIVQLEDRVAELAYVARDTKQKREFLEGFA
jgi:SWI/SNF-related matrix-associated actin-dependent regulator of chromatin subfamily D